MPKLSVLRILASEGQQRWHPLGGGQALSPAEVTVTCYNLQEDAGSIEDMRRCHRVLKTLISRQADRISHMQIGRKTGNNTDTMMEKKIADRYRI